MGTNYYAIPKMSESDKLKVVDALRADNYFDARRLIPEQYHIGKSSMGWDFLLNHNDWRFYNDYEEMKDWLKTCDIEDEYGSKQSIESFVIMVERKKKSGSRMNNPDWYVWKGEYVFSSSTDFS